MTCGGEDFALYQQIAPGFFYMLGVGKGLEEVIIPGINEIQPRRAFLACGAGILAQSAFDFLKTNETRKTHDRKGKNFNSINHKEPDRVP